MAKSQSHTKNKDTKSKVRVKEQTSKPYGTIIVTLFSILAAALSVYVYIMITTVPPLPDLKMDEWWGPYPLDPKQDTSIKPFRIEFSDIMINDLRERLLHRRSFPPPLEQAGFTYGFNSNFLTQVLDYWKNSYNFHDRERFLNKYDHFLTNIQGLDIHFMHVKPKVTEGQQVLPLLMLHGWPGSIREFYEIIPKLTTPRADRKFVFEVIAPSLPGYGFSQAAVRPGLGTAQIAVLMSNLMRRLGFTRYYIQGGDWGAAIGSNMATLFADQVAGFHTNAAITMHPLATVYTLLGSLWPRAIVEPELESRMYPLKEHFAFILEETGYLHLQATKPDTIGVALTDSPAGLAAYILEKFSTWTNPAYRTAGDGNLIKKFALTHLLDNVMIYWSTNSITTSMRLYAESFNKKHFALKLDQIPTEVPTWGLKFKHEVLYQPDCLLRLKFKNYLHSTVVEDGGHFAAFELPDIVADDVYEAVDTFLQFHKKENQPQKTVNDNKPEVKDNKPEVKDNKPEVKDTKPEVKDKKPEVKDNKPEVKDNEPKTIYDFTVKDINGKEVKLEKYKGQLLLIVNVASQCGLTETNYEQLNKLYEKYSKSKNFRILAFPCNQFGSQEPGNSQDIAKFTKEKGVQFDLFEKVEVNGPNAHPLWKFLKEKLSGTFYDDIKWNFSKFLVDRNGVHVQRFSPTTKPLDIEPILANY